MEGGEPTAYLAQVLWKVHPNRRQAIYEIEGEVYDASFVHPLVRLELHGMSRSNAIVGVAARLTANEHINAVLLQEWSKEGKKESRTPFVRTQREQVKRESFGKTTCTCSDESFWAFLKRSKFTITPHTSRSASSGATHEGCGVSQSKRTRRPAIQPSTFLTLRLGRGKART